MATKRLFTAIDLHPDIRENANQVQERLSNELGGVRWVDPEQMHVTLKYIGSVPEDQLGRVKAIVTECAQQQEPFSLRYQGVGQFPRKGTPRVVWMGVEDLSDEDRLTSCFSFLDERMTEVDVDRDDRDFHAHLTLGRVKDENRLGDVREAFDREQHTTLGEDRVDEIVLYESERRPDGAKYTVLDQASLA